MRHWLCYLTFFVITRFDSFEAQPYMSSNVPSQLRGKKMTDIRNKNVNIIVNMDPKQIANELWNVIRDHLGSYPQQDAALTLRQIETAITPVVMPSRRGGTIPVAQVAEDLETITRRLITNENPDIDPMRLEALTKEVSSDLMASLQNVWDGVEIGKNDSKMKRQELHGDEQEKFVDLMVKIKKSELADIVMDL